MFMHSLTELAEESIHAHIVVNQSMQVVDVDALLLHGVTLTQCHGVVLKCLMVHCHAVGSTDGILTPITLSS